MPPPLSLRALCLQPSPPSPQSPSHPAPAPCRPHTSHPLLSQAPGPNNPLTTSLSSVSWLCCRSLPPALPGAAVQKGSVPPRKRPTWEQECAEMKRQQLLRQQARRGPWGGGEWGSWGQLEPEWVRRERAPGRVEILQEIRKGERGPRDHGDDTVSQDRWEREHVGGDGTGGGWRCVGRQSGQLGPGEEAMGGWRSAQRDGWCRGRGAWTLTDGEGQCGTAW